MRMRPDLPSESHDAQLGEFSVARPTPTVIHEDSAFMEF